MYVYIIYTYIYLFFDLFMSKLNKDSSALHYQKITEKIQKKSRKSHQNLSEKEKTIKWEHGHEKNLSENEKQKLVEYWRRYYGMQKNQNFL